MLSRHYTYYFITVENLTASISALNVAGELTKKETRKISTNTVITRKKKSRKNNLHKLYQKSPKRYNSRRATGQYHNHRKARSRPVRNNVPSRHFNNNNVHRFYDDCSLDVQRLDHLNIMWLNGVYDYFNSVSMNFLHDTFS